MCMSEPAQLLSISRDRSEADVRVRGVQRRISLAPLSLDGVEVREGDWVLISVGLAFATIDDNEARALEAFLAGEEPP